jgi:hypothetical protein
MGNNAPFSQEILNEIFKISLADADRVISRESSTIEFKESFGWASLPKYLKTCAAYANTKGGYIVFGIANRPHRLAGLSGANMKMFEEIDPEKMSSNFNDHFSPEIEWAIQEYELQGKTFGLLYVHEAKDKPVVCTRDGGKELKEGDIYYRYRGRTERIKYPELRSILENKRETEQRLWMQHLANIARIGVREAGIFDLNTGQVTGSGGSFLIDESLLSELSFIKEGEFSEIKGKPTLKLIGNVEPIGGVPATILKKQIIKAKGIRTGDIVLSFLNQTAGIEPQEFIKQICFESTAFLPLYYYIKNAGIDKVQAVKLLEGVVSRSTSKAKLIGRLEKANTQQISISVGKTSSATKKRKFADSLCREKVNREISGKDLEYCLQAIRGLSAKDVKTHSNYLRALLRTWFNQHYSSAKGPLADNLRRAICWIDEALYGELT